MSDLNKKITELLSDSCKAAPDMTHSLKMKKGALFGTAGTLTVIGLIVGVKKIYSMKKAHKEKGEKILSGLQQGIANESTESIENYDSIREVNEEGNI